MGGPFYLTLRRIGGAGVSYSLNFTGGYMRTKKSLLTQKLKKERSRSGLCPFCKDGSVSYGDYDYFHGKIYQHNRCNQCKTKWDDCYTLSAVVETGSFDD
jgi:hypothetical protein